MLVADVIVMFPEYVRVPDESEPSEPVPVMRKLPPSASTVVAPV